MVSVLLRGTGKQLFVFFAYYNPYETVKLLIFGKGSKFRIGFGVQSLG